MCLNLIQLSSLSCRLVSVHSAASYQQDASAENKDCTNDVEDRGTNATSARKFCTLVVLNIKFNYVVFNSGISSIYLSSKYLVCCIKCYNYTKRRGQKIITFRRYKLCDGVSTFSKAIEGKSAVALYPTFSNISVIDFILVDFSDFCVLCFAVILISCCCSRSSCSISTIFQSIVSSVRSIFFIYFAVDDIYPELFMEQIFS